MKYVLNSKINHLPDESYVETLLRARGLNHDEMIQYLKPSKEVLYSPLLLKNMDAGAELLKKHLDANSIIYDVVDCDQDGVTSSAILYNYLKLIKPNIQILWSMHSGKQHGVELDKVPHEAKLIVIPDAGSNQYEEHKILKEQGFDILILDHHLCETESENAIVINNQLGKYPNRDLSGAGVVYKFIKYFDIKYGYNYADNFLDLAAMGIVGDMMDLRNLETRYIISQGLTNLKNYGLTRFALKQSFSIGNVDDITPTDVSFFIAPLVNAVIRVGTMAEKETLFKAFISGPNDTEPSTKRGAKPGDTEVIADKAARIATNARNHQNKMIDQSVQFLCGKIEKECLDENKVLLVALDDDESRYVNPNLTGLIAMKLCQMYNRPAIVIRLADDDIFKGSFRVNSNSPLANFKDFCTESGLVEYAEGHESAAGIGIAEKNLNKFIKYCNKKLANTNLGENSYLVDFEFDGNFCSDIESICIDLDAIKNVYGKGVEEPKIIVNKILFTQNDVFIMGKNKDSVKIEKDGIAFVKFKDADFAQKVQSYSIGAITVYGKMNLNQFMGNYTPQVIIEDYELENGRAMF